MTVFGDHELPIHIPADPANTVFRNKQAFLHAAKETLL